jgi:hypothetical protein
MYSRGWTLPEIAYKAVTYNKSESPSIDVCVDVQGVAASDSCLSISISNYSSTCRQLGPPPLLFSQSLISATGAQLFHTRARIHSQFESHGFVVRPTSWTREHWKYGGADFLQNPRIFSLQNGPRMRATGVLGRGGGQCCQIAVYTAK